MYLANKQPRAGPKEHIALKKQVNRTSFKNKCLPAELVTFDTNMGLVHTALHPENVFETSEDH